MVVEDERLVAVDLQQRLTKMGYKVPGITASGEDALRKAAEVLPDLVLMDIQLKGQMDGIDTAQILQTRLNIPVVYLTAFTDERTLERAKSTEPYGYLVKPFEAKELQIAIELALHKHGNVRRDRTHEQWLAGVIANLGAGIITIDRSGLVSMMNPQAEQYTGVQLQDALGRPFAELIRFVDDRGQDSPIWSAVRDNETTELLDVRINFPKTGRNAVVCGAVSAMGAPGERAAIVVFRDITTWLDLEKQYSRARRLEDLQRLAGGLAHQFSNFLTLISGYSESIARTFEPGDARVRDVRTMQKVADRAGNLTRDLLAFSRGQNLSLKNLDANQAIESICERIKLSVAQAVIEPKFEAAGNIETDPIQLEQMLVALVNNASEAMPEGGVITVRTSNFEADRGLATSFVDLPPGPYVRIDVTDTGVGMSYDTQTRVFEPFFTTKSRNLGISLAAVYGMVEQHRGRIWFESEPKKGTTFSICLPRVQAGARHAVSMPRGLRGSETIVTVEDDPDARAQARDTLLDLGYRVIEAASGKEALKICEDEAGQIDLVLTSAIMPNMTGSELARRLHAINPRIRVLFMSRYSEYALRHHGGVDEDAIIVQEPSDGVTLAQAVRKLLDSDLESAGTSGPA